MKLNKKIYKKERVEAAILAYKDITEIKVKEIENYYCLSFHNCKYDKKRTECEFENFLIGLEN